MYHSCFSIFKALVLRDKFKFYNPTIYPALSKSVLGSRSLHSYAFHNVGNSPLPPRLPCPHLSASPCSLTNTHLLFSLPGTATHTPNFFQLPLHFPQAKKTPSGLSFPISSSLEAVFDAPRPVLHRIPLLRYPSLLYLQSHSPQGIKPT